MLKSCINNFRLIMGVMSACERVFMRLWVYVCIKTEAYIHKIPTVPEFSGMVIFRSRLLT